MPERLVQFLPSPYKKTDFAAYVLLFDHTVAVLQEFASRNMQYLTFGTRRTARYTWVRDSESLRSWMTCVTMGESLADLSNHCRSCTQHITDITAVMMIPTVS